LVVLSRHEKLTAKIGNSATTEMKQISLVGNTYVKNMNARDFYTRRNANCFVLRVFKTNCLVLDDYCNGVAVYCGARFYGNVETQGKVAN
jgi:hypothetical protein